MNYQQRRQHFMAQLPKYSIAIFLAAPQQIRNGDTHYPYRQDSDFYYLSGVQEPNAIMLLQPATQKTLFFSEPHNPEKELWDGPRIGQDGAVTDYGMDEAYPLDDFPALLDRILQSDNIQRLYGPARYSSQLHEQLNKLPSRSRKSDPLATVWDEHNSDPILHEMRVHKDTDEIALIQKAIDITLEGHRHAMRQCRPGMKEYQLEALLLHAFCAQGARSPAYGSIVASGQHTCTLHYVSNEATLQPNDLLLIDAGAEYEGYAADITRTFPINGRYTSAQQAIYELTLAAQLAAIEQAKKGNPYSIMNETSRKVVTQGLVDLGILHGDVAGLIESEAYKPFYPHNAGHWLGLDVHDVGDYREKGRWRPLEVGMVFTVEPGIYIRPDQHVDEKWWHIGVRIEDDILVTAQGPKVLSAALPKTVQDIEMMMKEAIS